MAKTLIMQIGVGAVTLGWLYTLYLLDKATMIILAQDYEIKRLKR